jgi:anti-sigma B factor antagonist
MTTVELRTRIFDGYAVIVLRGELDTMDAEATGGAVAALAADGQQLIIDLEALDFIDCHAVGALLGVRKTARQAGGDVLLAAPRRPVLRLLTMLDVPDIYASVAAAADSVGKRDARRWVVSIARFRGVPSGAQYWRAAVPGARAGGRPWSPWWLRARSGPQG